MATAKDVAAYILEKQGRMTTWKLQKLVYYSQAWGLVWDNEPLFTDRIEAWANGPVVPNLYKEHRGKFFISRMRGGAPDNLLDYERETIDVVLDTYGDKSPQWLSNLTHREPPWREAREGMSAGERGNVQITIAAMADYYGSL